VDLLAEGNSSKQTLAAIFQWISQRADYELVKQNLRRMENGGITLRDLAQEKRRMGRSNSTLLDVVLCQASMAGLLCLSNRMPVNAVFELFSQESEVIGTSIFIWSELSDLSAVNSKRLL
jgi:hypothetical protein